MGSLHSISFLVCFVMTCSLYSIILTTKLVWVLNHSRLKALNKPVLGTVNIPKSDNTHNNTVAQKIKGGVRNML